MKTLLISSFAIILSFGACNIKSENGFPGNIMSKEGTGIIKTKEFKMEFDGIRVAQSISAEVVKSDVEKVVVTAPADIIEDILVENLKGTVYIHFKPNFNISAKNVAVKIFAKNLTSVQAGSSAKIKIRDQFTEDEIYIKSSSSASISGHVEANEMSIEVSSSGNFTGQIWAVNLNSKVSSSGDIKISGKSKNADLRASSSGTLDAKNVTTENADLQASSSGEVSISVSTQVNAAASSSGDISVTRKGDLKVLSQKESSGGSVSIH